MGVNKVLLLGRLGKDPELRVTSNQTAVCTFSFATGDRRKDSSGNWVDHTEWHNIVTYGKTAENCAQYLKKGSEAFIEGRIQTRKWQDKEGKDRYTTEIVAAVVQFVGGRRDSSHMSVVSGGDMGSSHEEVTAGRNLVNSLKSADALANSGNAAIASASVPEDVPFDDDDIPF